MLEELHFCCVKHDNKWNYLLHYYNFNGKNAKNFMFYMPHWHFFELEAKKSLLCSPIKNSTNFVSKKVPKGAAANRAGL